MTEMAIPAEYRDGLANRVRTARIDAGITQDEMARALDVAQTTYSKYEGGRGDDPASVLPHHLMERFCLICRVTMDWLVSGKENGFSAVPRPTQRVRKKRA